jgi:hypothetical protein
MYVKLRAAGLAAVFGALLTAGFLHGCAVGKAVKDNPVLASVVVQYATGKVIEAGKTPAARAIRAERVKTIAVTIKAAAKGRVVTLGELQLVAQGYIADLNLEPSDAMLANTLVLAVSSELEKKISAGALAESDVLVLNTALDWAIVAANLYSPTG